MTDDAGAYGKRVSAFVGGLFSTAVLAVLALSAMPESSARADPITPSKGKVRAAYEALMKAHCDLSKVSVGTPLEARILRNTPYAIAGRFFKSAALRALYANDGTWYRPRRHGAVARLSKADAVCVSRLKRLERKLRKKLPISKSIERVLTWHPIVFLTLRQGSDVARYGGAKGRIQNTRTMRRWTWSFTDYGACGGDGGPGQRGDCAGFVVTCELPKGEKDFRKLDCTATWSG